MASNSLAVALDVFNCISFSPMFSTILAVVSSSLMMLLLLLESIIVDWIGCWWLLGGVVVGSAL